MFLYTIHYLYVYIQPEVNQVWRKKKSKQLFFVNFWRSVKKSLKCEKTDVKLKVSSCGRGFKFCLICLTPFTFQVGKFFTFVYLWTEKKNLWIICKGISGKWNHLDYSSLCSMSKKIYLSELFTFICDCKENTQKELFFVLQSSETLRKMI